MEEDPKKPRILAEIAGPRHCIAAQAATIFVGWYDRLAQALERSGMESGEAARLADQITHSFLQTLDAGGYAFHERVAGAAAEAARATRH
ncbi:hypothetical protein QTH97_22825 [Variovorax sp. J22R24]|uniref:hypothetical protein n=1 Tax=Variovorax gracilis TaxID=3053502 RepID=UPI002577E133|nr:hypothetical protein [Variovorax sp. J22R24]MDM0107798.1 hypothetical protein [Variovorax sp. J22R24]